MSTIEAIENAVKGLSPSELAIFRGWFADFDGAVWDAQIEADGANGKFDSLAQEVLAEYRNGTAREI